MFWIIYSCRKGTEYNLGSAKVKVVDTGKNNNESLILVITYKKTNFLFTGDMPHSMGVKLCEDYSDLKNGFIKSSTPRRR